MDGRWEKREVFVPDGTHRVASRDIFGAERDLLYRDGTNELLGPTQSRAPVSTRNELVPSPSWPPRGINVEALVEMAAEIAIVAIPIAIKYGPAVVEKLVEWNNQRRAKSPKPGRRYIDTEPSPPATDIEKVDPQPVDVMTGEEFRRLVLLSAAGRAWLDQLHDRLSKAVVVDKDLTPELRAAIQLVLDGKTNQLDDVALGLLAVYFKQTLHVEPPQHVLHSIDAPPTD